MGKQVGISVDFQGGKVIVEFDRKLKHVELTPQQAGEFARAIIDKAMNASGVPYTTDSGIIIPSVLN